VGGYKFFGGRNMKLKGKDLIFISWIKRDGSGTKMVKKRLIELMQEDDFKVNCLSLTEKTYIACGFNSFVVRLKNDSQKHL
jgi:hypothetical protein